jgi:hypothetical protein
MPSGSPRFLSEKPMLPASVNVFCGVIMGFIAIEAAPERPWLFLFSALLSAFNLAVVAHKIAPRR